MPPRPHPRLKLVGRYTTRGSKDHQLIQVHYMKKTELGMAPGAITPHLSAVLPGQEGKAGSAQGARVRWACHIIASSILIVFGLSHILSFIHTDSRYAYAVNTVFPPLTNNTVFGVTGLILTGVALWIFRRRGLPSANGLLTVIVALLIWYRTSLALLGTGQPCECTGSIGVILGFSAAQERLVAILALAVLLLCLLMSQLAGLARFWQSTKSAVTRLAVLTAVMSVVSNTIHCHTAPALSMEGTVHLSVRTAQGPAIVTNSACRFRIVLGDAETWEIASTNINNPQWWSTAHFDGTNTYQSKPSLKEYLPSTGEVIPEEGSVITTIVPGPLPFLQGDDDWRVADLWSVFCTGAAARHLRVTSGSVHWPVPLWMPRSNPKAWMFRWHLHGYPGATPQSPWFGAIDIVRDESVVLKTPTEYRLHPEISHPLTPRGLENFNNLIGAGKAYTNGSLGVKIEVLGWAKVGSVSYPKEALVTQYGGGVANRPTRWVAVSVLAATTSEGERIMAPLPAARHVGVDDYRFRRKSKNREYECAVYRRTTGETWAAPNDPTLLAASDRHMANAPTFNQLLGRQRHYFAWTVFAVIVGVPMLIVLVRRNRTE